MINKLAADYAGIELGIGESLIMKAIGESTGRSLQVIKADQNEIGDLGLVAAKSRGNQPTMFKPKPLTVRAVRDGLMGIATTSGRRLTRAQRLRVSRSCYRQQMHPRLARELILRKTREVLVKLNSSYAFSKVNSGLVLPRRRS